MKTTLRNGRSAGMSPSQFNQQELAWGTRVEMEHTSSKKIAQRIAMDHLVEDQRYYQKLAKVHLDSGGVSSGASRKKRKLESALKRYLRDNASWIRRRFGEPGKFLGCGAWGCAWKLGSEVLKITTDPSEAANVARLSGQALISGVVETRKLCRAPGDAGLWVYLREYIEPFTSTDLKKLKRYEDLTALGHIQQAGWKWLRAKGARRTRYVDDYLNWVKILRPELPLVADAMAELWRREKLLLADVHLGNIGWALRDGDYEVVICDLGQSSKLAGRGVEWIERCQA